MKSVFTTIFFLVLTLPAVSQERVEQPPRSSLAGTVVNAQGGEPIKKATVEAISQNNGNGEAKVYSALTDADGHFKLESIEPGRYRVFVERTGFIEVNSHHRRSEGTEVALASDQQLKDLVLQVLPSAAVTGRVLDQDGDPMPDVEVSVARLGYSSCRPQFENAGTERTNDLGEYRISSLPPGKYFVHASPRADFTTVTDRSKPGEKPDSSYVTLFYPGATDPGGAAPIELHPGEEMPINFAMVRIQTFRVRGTVSTVQSTQTRSNEDGVVTLRRKGFDETFRQGEVDKDGKFELRGVPPGSYDVWMSTSSGEAASATATLEVGNSDVNNVHLIATSGAHVRGRLRAPSGNLDLSGFRVYLSLRDQDRYLLNPSTAQVNRDGSFGLEAVASGTYDVRVIGNAAGPTSYFVKSVLVAGRDASITGVRISGGDVVVEVLMSAASGQVEGSVIDHDQAAANATVVAVPSPSHRRMFDHFRSVLSDQRGQFQIQGLPPDDYTLLAWDEVESGAWCDPDFLKAYENAGEKVHVDEGGHLSTTLKLIPAQSSPK